jgi:hypothetical protein
MNGPALYTERQTMPPLLGVLFGVALLGALVALALPFLVKCSPPKPVEIAIVAFAAAGLLLSVALFNDLTTVVDARQVDVRFGSLKWFGKTIPLSEIREVDVVEYRPLRDFGGWGIRLGRFRGERTGCVNLRGNRGVRLALASGTTLMLFRVKSIVIGSATPEKLAEAIRAARGA